MAGPPLAAPRGFDSSVSGLGKQYGRRWALADCALRIPPGRVVGLVGPNGAGRRRCYAWPSACCELAIFAGLALVLTGFCFWWLRRRLA